MKLSMLVILFLCVFNCVELFAHPSAQEDPLKTAATDFLALLVKGDYAASVQTFDATMKKVFPAEKVEETWKTVIAQVGMYKKQTGIRIEKIQAYDAVIVTCEFERTALDIRIVFDSAKQIAGLFFTPAQKLTDAAYVNKAAFTERDVTVGADEWALPATLTVPIGNSAVPAVVLVHGSGPNDRDETVGPNKPFRDLAWGLASKGIAVLRYEKRTRQHGAKMIALKQPLTVKEETVDDALLAVALLRKTDGIDAKRIFVIGHSLGGMLLPRIGARDAELAGLVSMAGSTRPLEEMIIEQLTYIFSLDGVVSDEEQKKFDEVKAEVAKVKALKDSDASSLEYVFGVYPKYWLDLRDSYPPDAAKSLKQRLLFLQGERDYQVTMADFQNWQKALAGKTNVEFKSYPKLNHLFLEGEGKSAPAEYQTAGHVAAYVIDDLVNWMKK